MIFKSVYLYINSILLQFEKKKNPALFFKIDPRKIDLGFVCSITIPITQAYVSLSNLSTVISPRAYANFNSFIN